MLSLGSKPRVVNPSRSQVVVHAAKERPQSRIGKKPVQVPKEVTVTLKDNHLKVKVRLATIHAGISTQGLRIAYVVSQSDASLTGGAVSLRGACDCQSLRSHGRGRQLTVKLPA